MGSKGPLVKCLNCGDIIQSMHRHDMKVCKCWITSAEKLFHCITKIVETIDLTDDEQDIIVCYLTSSYKTGIAIDGGSDYTKISHNSDFEFIEDQPHGR